MIPESLQNTHRSVDVGIWGLNKLPVFSAKIKNRKPPSNSALLFLKNLLENFLIMRHIKYCHWISRAKREKWGRTEEKIWISDVLALEWSFLLKSHFFSIGTMDGLRNKGKRMPLWPTLATTKRFICGINTSSPDIFLGLETYALTGFVL